MSYNASETTTKSWTPIPARGRTSAAKGAIPRAVESAVSHRTPRVSMFTGSVLILSSLFLAFAYDSCGSKNTGYEFARGDGLRMGQPVFASSWGASGLYAVALAFAAFTFSLVLFSGRRPQCLQCRPLTTRTFAVAGALSLFVIPDLPWGVVLSWANDLMPEFGISTDVLLAVAAAVTPLVLASSLRSRFLRNEPWLTWLFGIAARSVC